MTLRMFAAIAALGATLVVTGCVPSEPVITPAETGATAPIFASDEEALAAAVAAFDGYNAANARIAADNWTEPNRVAEYTEDSWFEKLVVDFAKLREQEIRFLGSVTYSAPTLQQRWEEGGLAHVAAYFCGDASGHLVTKGSSEPYRPESVKDTFLVEVFFVSDRVASPRLIVKEVGEWLDPTGC